LAVALALDGGWFLCLIANALLFPESRGLSDLVFLETSLVFWPIPALTVAVLGHSGRWFGRRRFLFVMLAMLAAPALTCFFPYPQIYWLAIDNLANRRELSTRGAALQPVVDGLAGCLRTQGTESRDPSACLNQVWPRPLPGHGRNLGQLTFYGGRDGFAVSAWATPREREPGIGNVSYSSLEREWRWHSTEPLEAIRRLAGTEEEKAGWNCRFDGTSWTCSQPALR
jgi:hypothetical protein